MKTCRKLAFVLLLPLLTLSLAGCPQRTTIAEIKQDPGRYRDKEVALRGKVTQAFGALGQGAEVETVGRVIAGATFLGRDYGTSLRERKHRTV